jgi:hypothetical protein
MRAYARAGRNTAVSVGPVGLILLWPLYATYYVFATFVVVGRAIAYAFRGTR